MMAFAGVVITVEHASARVPRRLHDLGLDPALLSSHHAWDVGAAPVGRQLARAFDAPLHLGKWSRLVVDLNRSSSHPRIVARTLEPGGVPIPANQLTVAERCQRVETYWRPWRDAVGVALDAQIERHGCVLHISVHSFTDRLDHEVRENEFGLLYRPSRNTERKLADRLHKRLAVRGHRVWRNRPYSGLEDGHNMRLRSDRPASRYVGMEIEMNQREVSAQSGARRFGRDLVAAFEPEIERG